ncbi:MAG: sigma-70 family RNA polymerase sigma factor [Myxococcaceae bacterium]
MATTAAHLEEHRTALTGHCYRMLGSAMEADDAVQETMVRAWKSLERFDGRASMRTWLYRIATNVCLDALNDRSRRERPFECGPLGHVDAELTEKPRTHWLEPVPSSAAIPSDEDPSKAVVLRESIRLAFVAALQHLPPKQRAVLILSEVLGWSASEIAEGLDTSVASVNSALQRARATLQSRDLGEEKASLSDDQSKLLESFVTAFERYDVNALTALLREDATLSMPPFELWLQGPETIATWLNGRGNGCKGSRLVPTSANGFPAFGQYRLAADGKSHTPWALIILELRGDRIARWNSFLDTQTLFARFGLPPSVPLRS